MNFFQVQPQECHPSKGNVLIASPLMYDYRFVHSVVLIITHNAQGSMGIIMNHCFYGGLTLNQLFPEFQSLPDIPIFRGGPMETDTIFFIHRISQLKGSMLIGNGLYLNGEFEALKEYLLDKQPVEGMIKFFAGYRGWEKDELLEEFSDKRWLIGRVNDNDILNTPQEALWKNCMKRLEGYYHHWMNYPKRPLFN